MRPTAVLAFALVGCQRPDVASSEIGVGETSTGTPDSGEDPSVSSTSASSASSASATSPSEDDSGETNASDSSTSTSSGESSTTSSSDGSDAESSSSGGSDDELPDGEYICATLISESGMNPFAGSISGRMALQIDGGSVEIADVGEDCEWNVISTFDCDGDALRMSGDGTRLLSIERWSEEGESARDGTRIYALPSGDLLSGTRPTLISDSMWANEVSHDGSVFSMCWGGGGFMNCSAGSVPAGADIIDGWANYLAVAKVAPSGDYVVASGFYAVGYYDVSTSHATIYGADGAIAAVVDGLVQGFVDADHVLVSRYGDADADDFLGSAIVAMDGSSVATTDLPDLWGLTLVTDGEVLGRDADDLDLPKIYDVYSETLLWAPSRGGVIAAAGPDHLLWSTGEHVYLLRWR